MGGSGEKMNLFDVLLMSDIARYVLFPKLHLVDLNRLLRICSILPRQQLTHQFLQPRIRSFCNQFSETTAQIAKIVDKDWSLRWMKHFLKKHDRPDSMALACVSVYYASKGYSFEQCCQDYVLPSKFTPTEIIRTATAHQIMTSLSMDNFHFLNLYQNETLSTAKDLQIYDHILLFTLCIIVDGIPEPHELRMFISSYINPALRQANNSSTSMPIEFALFLPMRALAKEETLRLQNNKANAKMRPPYTFIYDYQIDKSFPDDDCNFHYGTSRLIQDAGHFLSAQGISLHQKPVKVTCPFPSHQQDWRCFRYNEQEMTHGNNGPSFQIPAWAKPAIQHMQQMTWQRLVIDKSIQFGRLRKRVLKRQRKMQLEYYPRSNGTQYHDGIVWAALKKCQQNNPQFKNLERPNLNVIYTTTAKMDFHPFVYTNQEFRIGCLMIDDAPPYRMSYCGFVSRPFHKNRDDTLAIYVVDDSNRGQQDWQTLMLENVLPAFCDSLCH